MMVRAACVILAKRDCALSCASVGSSSEGLQSLPVTVLRVCLLVRKYMSECSHTLPLMVLTVSIGRIFAIVICVRFTHVTCRVATLFALRCYVVCPLGVTYVAL